MLLLVVPPRGDSFHLSGARPPCACGPPRPGPLRRAVLVVPGGPGGPRWPWLAGLRLSRPRAPFLFSVRRVLVGGGLLVVAACCPGGALAAALAVPAYAFGLVLAGPGPARGAPSPLKQWPACSGARAITRSPARPAWPPSWVPASLPLAACEGVALLLLLEVCILW